MPRVIVKSGCINNKKHRSQVTKYIATREGVEYCNSSNGDLPATKKQKKLVNELMKDYPKCKKLSENIDYKENSTRKNASELIQTILENNLDTVLKKENYVQYIAKRPRVEKLGEHGLFSFQEQPINLDDITQEIKDHKGVVWTHIISLTREDAERLGYDNAEAWKQCCRAKSIDLADAMKINPNNLKWVAAFHNEGHHPHIHMMVYSMNPKEGYLTGEGIKKIQSAFGKEIFQQDIYNLYKGQTEVRDELKRFSKQVVLSTLKSFNAEHTDNQLDVVEKIKDLRVGLNEYHGKLAYAYLPKDLKEKVNAVLDEMEKDQHMAVLYEQWKNYKSEISKTYQDKLVEQLPLSAQQEFRSIKNMILNEVASIRLKDLEMSEVISKEKEENDFKSLHVKSVVMAKEKIVVQGTTLTDASTVAYLSARMFHQLSKVFEEQFPLHKFNALDNVDRKILQKMRIKKQQQGQKM